MELDDTDQRRSHCTHSCPYRISSPKGKTFNVKVICHG